ncbi:MAG TPA: transferase hexapeptide repeat containing protein, partial [Cyanobacteria bacterium UBA11369]|nr:transferase hexapeptide repeat containing protein [Cyanobacteria bacterium UBA11369]
NWLDKLIGSISDESAFLEALEYGRAFRQADKPS